MKTNRKNNRGYTLIEVVIVVGCIALLSAIFGPKLVGMFSGTATTQHVANAKAINDLVNEFTGAGGSTGAYALGTVTTNGSIRIDTIDDLTTDLQAGAYAGGTLYQLQAGTVATGNATLAAGVLSVPTN
jgi:prepilin-type N-terminal cleavage/methylation domain-containing protein